MLRHNNSLIAVTAATAAAALSLFAQASKKPVTLDALKTPARPLAELRAGVSWSPSGKHFAFRRGEDLMIYDAATRTSKPLATGKEMKPVKATAAKPAEATPFDWENRRVRDENMQWTSDGKHLLYVSGGDLFWISTENIAPVQLTATEGAERDPKLSPDGKKVSFRRVHDLYVMDIESKKETRLTSNGTATLWNGELDWVYPEELDLGTAHWWSPDSKSIAYLQFDVSRIPLYPHAELLKPSPYAEPQRYPQAGDPNSDVRLGVVAISGNSATKWIDLGDTRDTWLIARIHWGLDSKNVYVHRLARIQNRLDLLKVSASTGAMTEVLRETDPYWINLADDFRFLSDGKRFLWTSERDGFRHIYLYSNDGRDSVQLTKGQWEVDSIAGVDEAAQTIYYVSTEPSPLERHVYSIKFDGTGKTKLSTKEGTNSVSMSPTCDYFLLTHSSLTSPSRTTLHAKNGSELGVYREGDRKQADEYDILPTELTSFKTSDGVTIYGRIIKPKGFQPGTKYPAIVSVYGGPHAQAVRNSWAGTVSWEQVMAHKGFVIWQCDNRGTANRGHAFEAAVFRKLGQKELEDQREGVKYLVSLGYVDPARIGIQGWSYGGFMTLNAMLNAGDVFKAGISGAPVTNFKNYDTIYTERYMGLPSENPDGYAGTNLPLKAGNLKGNLLLVHNFEDDNVLFQNMLQATEALQRNGKLFELMVYPQKAHGVSGGLRNHLNELMTSFFERTLKN